MAERFTANCKKLGLLVHGDFIIGLPGETRESIRKTIDFAKRLDTETIQVSIAHPYPGTEFYDYVKNNGLITIDSMTDETGHQLPNIIYPGLDRGELVEWVERFYSGPCSANSALSAVITSLPLWSTRSMIVRSGSSWPMSCTTAVIAGSLTTWQRSSVHPLGEGNIARAFQVCIDYADEFHAPPA